MALKKQYGKMVMAWHVATSNVIGEESGPTAIAFGSSDHRAHRYFLDASEFVLATDEKSSQQTALWSVLKKPVDGEVVGMERTKVLVKLMPSIVTLTHRAMIAMLIYEAIKSSTFHNPFGIAGAIVSLCIWIVHFEATAFFQGPDDLIIFMAIVTVLSAYYFLYARNHQTFSLEENRVLLVAHILKSNKSGSRVARGTRCSDDPASAAMRAEAFPVLPIAVSFGTFAHVLFYQNNT